MSTKNDPRKVKVGFRLSPVVVLTLRQTASLSGHSLNWIVENGILAFCRRIKPAPKA